MSENTKTNNTIYVPDAPAVAGLAFRGFRGEEDFPAMLAVINGCKYADGIERNDTLEQISRNYRHLVNSDSAQDMLFAEVNGEVVGYGRLLWYQELSGLYLYQHFNFLLPQWRGQGIRRAMLHYNERRLRQIAAGHPAPAVPVASGTFEGSPRAFEAWANDTETHWAGLLTEEGYRAVRFGFEMVRPDLEDIPDRPLPPGLEVRPVQREHLPILWAAAKEAFRDDWGYSEQGWDQGYANMLEDPEFDPSLWQVAWDGDQPVGMVQAFIDAEQNREYGRKRGWTEGISVRRPWRRRGVAKALIARSLRDIKQRGMTEAALGVDADNPNGALQLYRSMGFHVVKRHTTYRKAM